VVTIAVQGSGEVIRSDGYIVTNNHVIAPAAGAGSVQVQFTDGQTAAATITDRDPQTDLAVLKVDASRQLPVIPIGSSASVQVGEAAVVIGAPLGLSRTVTFGIIGALDLPSRSRRTIIRLPCWSGVPDRRGHQPRPQRRVHGQLLGAAHRNPVGRRDRAQLIRRVGGIGLGFAIPVDEAMTIADGSSRRARSRTPTWAWRPRSYPRRPPPRAAFPAACTSRPSRPAAPAPRPG
jgi:putative serine protease PepD